MATQCRTCPSPSLLSLPASSLSSPIRSLFTASGSIDLRTLCIAPGRHCWAIYVDVLVLESGGSLLDTMALAVFAALLDTRLPRLRLITGETPEDVEVEVEEDPSATEPFPGAEGIPVCVTFLQVPASMMAGKPRSMRFDTDRHPFPHSDWGPQSCRC